MKIMTKDKAEYFLSLSYYLVADSYLTGVAAVMEHTDFDGLHIQATIWKGRDGKYEMPKRLNVTLDKLWIVYKRCGVNRVRLFHYKEVQEDNKWPHENNYWRIDYS